MKPRRIYVPAGRDILPPMTPTQTRANGLGTPRLPQFWLTVALRLFVELVLNVASTFRMKARRSPVIGTPTTPPNLPERTTDTQSKETQTAVQPDSLNSAHAEQRSSAARPSKHERVLTTPSVSLGSRQASHLPQCSALMEATQRTVATKGNCLHQLKTGGGGSPRLRGETEGALAISTTLARVSKHANKNAPA